MEEIMIQLDEAREVLSQRARQIEERDETIAELEEDLANSKVRIVQTKL